MNKSHSQTYRQVGEPRSSEQIRDEVEQTRSRMAETLDALEEKLSPRKLIDQLFDSVENARNQSRAFDTVVRNPIPVMLVAAGAGWLAAKALMGNERPEAPGHAVEPPAGSASDEQGGMMHAMKEKASDAAHRVGESVSSATERVSDAASGIGQRVSSMVGGLYDKSSRAAERVYDKAAPAGRSAWDLFEDHPLMVGAAVVVAGVLTGLAIPMTRRENLWMGETRDQFVENVQERGRDIAERGKHVAGAAAEAAREEAKRQVDAVKQDISGAAEAVVQSAKDAAKEEAREQRLTGEDLKREARQVAKPVTQGQPQSGSQGPSGWKQP